MRRIKRKELLLLIVAVILLTGCSPKLKCKIDGYVEGRKYTSTLVVKFENEKPSVYNFKDKMIFDPQAPEAELYYHSKYDEYSTLISEKFARISNNTDNITLKLKYDFTKDKSTQEDKLFVSRNDTIDVARNKLESIGYKCK